MKDQLSIEEQVAQLTEEQKDTILKVDLIGGLCVLLGVVPVVVLMLFNMLAILDVSLPFEIAGGMVAVNFVLMALCFVFVIGVLVFVKIKFPYYSGKKCDYIRKMRKGK